MAASIVVVGSSNTDMVIKTITLPGPGQTILGGEFFMNAGGKGANQAVAAARLNGSVTFVAKTGNDVFGTTAMDQFNKEGIDCQYILTDPLAASGVALITVDAQGENCIVVAPGANSRLSTDDVALASEAILRAEVILVQLEIPLETVAKLIELGATAGKRVILNPAPACALPSEMLKGVTVITPNEHEAELLTGIAVNDIISAKEAARVLAEKGIRTVIITLGKQGALLWEEGAGRIVPVPAVNAVDTTAAGDVFNGALAVALAEGQAMSDAVVFANHAAALSVTKWGAQASAPSRKETELFMKQGSKT